MSTNYIQPFDEDMEHINSKALDGLVEETAEFLDGIRSKDRILIVADADSDGISAGGKIKNLLQRRFPKNEIGHSFFDLADDRFMMRASKDYSHIIIADKWFDNEPERQAPIVELLYRGVDILSIDHHDRDFPEVDMSRIPHEYNPLIPETMVWAPGEGIRTSGNLTFISPKRLGADVDSSVLTSGIIARRIALALDGGIIDNPQSLALSVFGDGAEDSWAQIKQMVNGTSRAVEDLSSSINLGHNLKDVRGLVSAMTSSIPDLYEELGFLQEVESLRRLREFIQMRANQIVEAFNNESKYLYYKVSGEAVSAIRRKIPGLRTNILFYKGGSTAISKRLEEKKPVIVTQEVARRGGNHTIEIAIKYDGDKDKFDTRDLAGIFQGGGRAKASGATVQIEKGRSATSVEEEIRDKVADYFR